MTLEQLLIACRTKLQLYREQHSGEYIGGMEYMALRRELDAAIERLSQQDKMKPWRDDLLEDFNKPLPGAAEQQQAESED